MDYRCFFGLQIFKLKKVIQNFLGSKMPDILVVEEIPKISLKKKKIFLLFTGLRKWITRMDIIGLCQIIFGIHE